MSNGNNENKPKGPSELDILFIRTALYQNRHSFREVFEFVARFTSLSPYNAMLVRIQRPGATYVASADEWKEKFNRTVRPGANPLIILIPFGPVHFVYDLQDTEGTEPFPQELLEPFRIDDRHYEAHCRRWLNELIPRVAADGIGYYEANYGTNLAGKIVTEKPPYKVQRYGSGRRTSRKIKIAYNLIINRNLGYTEKFVTVLHELAHLYCGHQGSFDTSRWPDRRGLPVNIREIEAESTAWLVCRRLGLNPRSEKYLSNYISRESGVLHKFSLDTVLRAVGIIERRLKGPVAPVKDLVIND